MNLTPPLLDEGCRCCPGNIFLKPSSFITFPPRQSTAPSSFSFVCSISVRKEFLCIVISTYFHLHLLFNLLSLDSQPAIYISFYIYFLPIFPLSVFLPSFLSLFLSLTFFSSFSQLFFWFSLYLHSSHLSSFTPSFLISRFHSFSKFFLHDIII